MRAVHTRRRPSHSFVMHYPHTAAGALYGAFAIPLVFLLTLFVLLHFEHGRFVPIEPSFTTISPAFLAVAAAFTLARLGIAFALALLAALPLAIFATHSGLAQKILLPIFDVLQSVPFLAFFPVMVGLFLMLGFGDGAAISILFLTMLWSIVFALVGGVGLIPRDIMYAAEAFGVTGAAYYRRIVLPALVPQLVIGSLLALAQGWNIIIVAEVIRTYAADASSVPNLFGLGSLMVESAAAGNNALFIAALATTVLIIALINILIWQPLLRYAQKYKFE